MKRPRRLMEAIFCVQHCETLLSPVQTLTAWASCQPSSPDKLALCQFFRAFFCPRFLVPRFFSPALTFGRFFFTCAIDVCAMPLKTQGMDANNPNQKQEQHKWARRGLWTAGTLGVLWALAWGLSWALVPMILKSQLEKIAGEALGRKVTVGQVDFKPWTLELELRDLTVARLDGKAQLSVKRIYLDAALQSLVERAPVVDAVAVEGVNLNLAHLGDGKYDIDDILERLNKPSGKPPSDPPKFALFNLALTGAAVDFSDKTVNRTHQLRDLTLAVPFLSNLDSRREVKTEPKLAFKLNGSSFDSVAQTTPFAQSRKTDASIRFTGVDLKPYLGYVPASLPVRLVGAVLNADIKLAFEQVARPSVKLSGVVEATGVKVTDPRAQGLLAFEGLKLTLDDVRPLEQVVKISLLELSAPTLEVSRDTAGNINLQLLPGSASANRSANLATNPVANPVASPTLAVKSPENSNTPNNIATNSSGTLAVATLDSKKEVWKLEIAKLAVRGGAVTWRDDATAPQARLALRDVVLDASGIALPFAQPLHFSGTAALAGVAATAVDANAKPVAKPVAKTAAKTTAKTATRIGNQAPNASSSVGAATALRTALPLPPDAAAAIAFTGSATDQAATVNATLRQAPLALAAPYLAQFIEPSLGGSVSAELAVNWKPSELNLGVKLLTLDNLALLAKPGPPGKSVKPAKPAKGEKAAAPLASLKKLEIADARVDLGAKTVSVGKLTLDQLKAAVERGQDQRWMFERWIKPAPLAQPPQQRSSIASSKTLPAPARRAGGGAKAALAAKDAKDAKTPATKPWTVTLADVSLNASGFTYLDQATPKPVSFELSAIKAQVKAFSSDGKKPFPLTVSARIRAPQGEPGALDYRGNLGLSPLAAQGKVVATQIPVHAFEPYFGDALNIELLRADAGFRGDVRFVSGANGPTVKVTGDSVVEEFRANSAVAKLTGSDAPVNPATAGTVATVGGAGAAGAARGASGAGTAGDLKISEELLSWKALSLRGVEVAIAPGSATTVTVSETALTDFFARVLINETGRINLQDLVKSSAAPEGSGPAGSTPAPDATNNIAINVGGTRAIGKNDAVSAPARANRQSSPAVAAAPAAGALDPLITVGPISLVNGKVYFSDRFVRPNYSANLSELTGKLSAFSSVAGQGAPTPGRGAPVAGGVAATPAAEAAVAPAGAPAGAPAVAPNAPQMADLELRGRAEGTASLEILGKLNPLAKPLALDIKGKVRDLELAPLSPYSVKYAGYGIERGKLSVDVGYVVLPDGNLSATNNIILNQLTFGDKVEGAPNSLPVKLAVALLADRNGVIDINLPISGSLNDPQFKLGPIIFKVIVNLIVKAITSPFSLLASAFGGGGEELSMVAFAPGTAALGPQARAGLDKVAKALTDRPGLKMTVVGTASLEAERDAYKHERLRALLQAEKRRAAVVSGVARGVGGGVGGAVGAGVAGGATPPAAVPVAIAPLSAASASSASSASSAAQGAIPAASASAATAALALAVTEVETPALLKEVYKRADMAKPRNLIGIAKDLPPAEMQALLLANIAVTEDAMRELALQRGVAVKEYLADKQLPPERLFLGAAKPGAIDAKWTPRAELSLLTN